MYSILWATHETTKNEGWSNGKGFKGAAERETNMPGRVREGEHHQQK